MPDEHRKTPRWGRIVAAAGIGLAKSAVLSALVLGPGMLIMEEHLFLGWLWLLVGSFAMMAWSYRKEWRMTRIAILAPPLAAIGAFLVQLVIFGQEPSLLWGAIALVAGLAVGFARGETHQVFARDNAIFAQRTIGFLAVWLLCYLITQYFSMMGQRDYLPIAHASGAFSAAMLTMVAIMLWGKFARQKLVLAATAAKADRPRKRKAKPKRKASPKPPKTMIIILGLLTFGALSADVPHADANVVSRTAPDFSRLRPTPELYFDYPVPESRQLPGGPQVPIEFDSRSGCDVMLGIYSPNPNYPTGRPQPGDADAWLNRLGDTLPIRRVVPNSIRNYCSANPSAIYCTECRPSVAGPGAVPAPEPGAGEAGVSVAQPGGGAVAPPGGGVGAVVKNPPISVPEAGAQAGATAAVITSVIVIIGASAVSVTNAVSNAAVQTAGSSAGAAPRAPPPPPGTDAGQDVINPLTLDPFDTDGNGNYLVPNERGEWVWTDADGARKAAAAMQGQADQRSGEVAEHDRQTSAMQKKWQTDWDTRQREEEAQVRDSGYVYDPETDTWRKPPKMPKLGEIPDTQGIGYTTDYVPGWVFVDVNTQTLDGIYDKLDQLERDALDNYSDLDWLIGQAEEAGDSWLADQLRKNKAKVGEHIGRIQTGKANITGAIADENRRVSDFNDRIHSVGAADVGREIKDVVVNLVTHPVESLGDPLFVDDVQKGIAAAELVRKGEGIELRPGLMGYGTVKVGPSIAERFDGALGKVGSLSDSLREAEQRGDQEEIARLTAELNAARAEAQRLSGELQQHVRNIRDWQVRSGVANISIARKGAEIAAATSAPAQVGARSSVVGLVEDWQRGTGIFSRSIRSTGELSAPVPKIKIRPGGTTVNYDSPVKPPTQTTWYPPERRPDWSRRPEQIIRTERPRIPSQPKPPMQGIESGEIELPRSRPRDWPGIPNEEGELPKVPPEKWPKDPKWVDDLEPRPPEIPAESADGAHLADMGRSRLPPEPEPPTPGSSPPEPPAPSRPPTSPEPSAPSRPPTPPEPQVRSGASVKVIDEVHAHLEQNPLQRQDRYINISGQRASQMEQSQLLQPASESGGTSDVIYSTRKGAGPAGYLGGDETTHVVRVPAENTVDVSRVTSSGTFLDAGGREIPLDTVRGRIIALPAQEGTGDKLWYVRPNGKLSPDIPRSLVKRWSTTAKDWI